MKVEIDGAVRSEYEYNGLNWRTVARADADPTHDGTLDRERVYYYSQNWQVLEVRINDTLDEDQTTDRLAQQVWGARYIDDAIHRRVSEDLTDDDPDTTWEQRLFYLTDAIFSVAAVVDGRADLIERVRYTPYGEARHQRLGDVDGDGDTDGADHAILLGASGTVIGDAGYVVDADLDRDGEIDSADDAILQNDWGPAEPAGQISAADNPIGYAGYVFNAECAVYTVRNRSYAPSLGRWLERDPAGYTAGMSLYHFKSNSPTLRLDSTGLDDWQPKLTGGPNNLDNFDAIASGGSFLTGWQLFGQAKAEATDHSIVITRRSDLWFFPGAGVFQADTIYHESNFTSVLVEWATIVPTLSLDIVCNNQGDIHASGWGPQQTTFGAAGNLAAWINYGIDTNDTHLDLVAQLGVAYSTESNLTINAGVNVGGPLLNFGLGFSYSVPGVNKVAYSIVQEWEWDCVKTCG